VRFVEALRRDLSTALARLRLAVRPVLVAYLALVVGLLTLVVVPLAFLVGGSLWSTDPFTPGGHFTLANYVSTYLDPRTYDLLGNTLVVAAGTTLWANLIGVGMAWVVVRTDTPFRGFLESAVVVPYVLPSYLLAVAYVFVFGPDIGLANRVLESLLGVTLSIYSFWGIVFVKGISYAPLCFLMTRAAFANFDAALEDAARVSGAGVLTTLRTVTLPLVAPTVTASLLLIFTKGLETFSVPAILGLPASPPIYVFSTRIWRALSLETPPNYGLATALATALVLLAGSGLLLQRRTTGVQERFSTVGGHGVRLRRLEIGAWRWVVLLTAAAFLLVGIVLPFGVLLVASVSSVWFGELFFRSESVAFTLENYRTMFGMADFLTAVTNSLLLATVGAFVGMLLATLSSHFVVKGGGDRSGLIDRTAAVVDYVTYVPAAVPGIVFATGVLWFVLTVPAFGLYGSVWLLGLAYVAHHLPVATRTTHGAIAQLDDELEEQARIEGAGPLRVLIDVVLPLIDRHFVAGFLLLFVSMLRELPISILLYSRESLVLPVLVFNMKLVGEYETLAALGVTMTVLVLAVLAAVRYWTDVSVAR
jgi:iron(III) transport system permease protein